MSDKKKRFKLLDINRDGKGISKKKAAESGLQLHVAVTVSAGAQRGAVRVHAVTDHGAGVLFDLGEGFGAHGAEHPEALIHHPLHGGAGLLHIVAVQTAAVGIE